jgi:hypothetical protein
MKILVTLNIFLFELILLVFTTGSSAENAQQTNVARFKEYLSGNTQKIELKYTVQSAEQSKPTKNRILWNPDEFVHESQYLKPDASEYKYAFRAHGYYNNQYWHCHEQDNSNALILSLFRTPDEKLIKMLNENDGITTQQSMMYKILFFGIIDARPNGIRFDGDMIVHAREPNFKNSPLRIFEDKLAGIDYIYNGLPVSTHYKYDVIFRNFEFIPSDITISYKFPNMENPMKEHIKIESFASGSNGEFDPEKRYKEAQLVIIGEQFIGEVKFK